MRIWSLRPCQSIIIIQPAIKSSFYPLNVSSPGRDTPSLPTSLPPSFPSGLFSMTALLSPANHPLVTNKFILKFHLRHRVYSGITNKSYLYGRLAYSQFRCQGLSHSYPRVLVPLENRLHPLQLSYCEGRSFAAVSLFALFGSGWDPSYVS